MRYRKDTVPKDIEGPPFECHVCGHMSTAKHGLIAHMRRHTGERPFKCHICNKSFSQSSTLYTHFNTHTGEKPFKCTICDKSFSQSSAQKRHIRSHSGERPFKCYLCLKLFSRRSTLSVHFLHAHGITITEEQLDASSVDLPNRPTEQSHVGENHELSEACQDPFSCLEKSEWTILFSLTKRQFFSSEDFSSNSMDNLLLYYHTVYYYLCQTLLGKCTYSWFTLNIHTSCRLQWCPVLKNLVTKHHSHRLFS
jgi:glass-like protein